MGVRREREKVYRYKNVYNSLNFYYGKKVFRIKGKISSWEEIEVVSRIFYEKLEQLLYTKEINSQIFEKSIEKVLKINQLYDKSFFEVLKEKNFHMESINILVMRIFDYVYHNIKKNLPYAKKLSIISGSISELLENTFKYSDGEFCITCGIKKGKFPLIIKIENKYNRSDENVIENLNKLQEGIEEVSKYEDPNEAFLQIMKQRLEDDYKEDKKHSRLGFAKIRMDTQAKITLSMISNTFADQGITITVSVPMEIFSDEEVGQIFQKLLEINDDKIT
jgi:hypothetical protein